MSTIFIPTATNIALEAQITDPPSTNGQARGLAIVAHPLGRLGGSLQDHVVQSLCHFFSQSRALRVVAFNSRGVGESSGSASWSGKSECEDYQAILDFSIQSFVRDYPNSRKSELYVCGYSAGSLYASSTKVSSQALNLLPFREGPRPRYILISLPVSWVWALSLFKSSMFQDALHGLLKASGRATPRRRTASSESTQSGDGREKQNTEENEQIAVDMLVAFGLQDQLTKGDTYESWLLSLRAITPYSSVRPDAKSNALPTSKGHYNQSTMEEVRIDGADHFWTKNGSLSKLVNSIARWSERLDELERDGR